MKNIISKRILREFQKRYPDSAGALNAWHAEAKAAEWKTPIAVKAQFRSASILKDSRVVFNICGNKYRLIVKINYDHEVIRIRFVGTHKEYDAIDAETI
jgi:mRNA interferase HigB